MRVDLSPRPLAVISALALACGLAAAWLSAEFLGGLPLGPGDWRLIFWTGIAAASLVLVGGLAAWSAFASWRREKSPGFRWLHAINAFLLPFICVAVYKTILGWAMGSGREAAVYGGLAVLALALAWYLNLAEEDERSREMAALARRLKLRFARGDALGLAERFSSFQPFGLAPGGSIRNVIHGEMQGRRFLAFDYLSPVADDPTVARDPQSGRPGPVHDFRHEMTAAMFSFPDCIFPGCLVAAHEVLGTISRAAPASSIDFESHEFNGHCGVWGLDRQFAYAVVDPRMMEFLLSNSGWAFEIAGPYIMVYNGKRWAVDEFDAAIRALTGFVEQVPGHLWANWRSLSKTAPNSRP